MSDASTGAIIIAVDETVTDDMPAARSTTTQVLNSGAVTTPDSGIYHHRGRYPQRDIMDKQYRTPPTATCARSVSTKAAIAATVQAGAPNVHVDDTRSNGRMGRIASRSSTADQHGELLAIAAIE